MSKPDGYFFVITPLQYLCALEARETFRENIQNTCLVIMGTYSPTLRQIRNMVDESSGWTTVLYRSRDEHGLSTLGRINYVKSAIYMRRFLKQITTKITSGDMLFVSNLNNNATRWLTSKYEKNNIYVLDDGLATVVTLLDDRKNSVRPKIGFQKLVNLTVLPSKKIKRERITFFSLYDNLPFYPSKRYPNRLSHVKKIFYPQELNKVNNVIFVGQYLSKLGVIPADKYIRSVNSVREEALRRGRNFFYYTHRSDDMEFPEEWNVVRGDQPLELMFREEGYIPAHVFSFYSSALPNLKIMFGDKIECHYLKPLDSWINENHKKTVSVIFDYLSQVAPSLGTITSASKI